MIIGVATQLKGPDQSMMLPPVQCIRLDQWEVFMRVRVKQLGFNFNLRS